MKKVVTTLPPEKHIQISHLMGNEIIAYRCKNSESVCVLHKMNKGNTWGFFSLSCSNSSPTYVAEGFYGSLSLANSQRDCMVFDNQQELIEAIYKKQF